MIEPCLAAPGAWRGRLRALLVFAALFVWVLMPALVPSTPGETPGGLAALPRLPGLLVCLAWFAGLPGARGRAERLFDWASALPLAGLALAVDGATGQLPTVEYVLGASALLFGLAYAAGCQSRVYAALWFVLVPGLAVWLALSAATGVEGGPIVERVSPLAFLWSGSRAGFPVVAVAAVLCLVVTSGASRGGFGKEPATLQGLALGLSLGLAPVLEETGIRMLELELEGPIGVLLIDCGARGSTRISGELLAGERRRVRLPVPVREGDPLPTVSPVRGVRIIGLQPLQPARAFPGRFPPAPIQRRVWPGIVAGALALGAAFLVMALRYSRRLALSTPRRCALALITGVLGAGVAYLAAPRAFPGVVYRQVLDGPGASGVVTAVYSGVFSEDSELRLLSGEQPARIVVRPGVSVSIDVALPSVGRVAPGRLAAPGQEIVVESSVVLPVSGLSPAFNGSGDFEQSFTRDAVGTWSSHGSWARGARLGPGRPGAPPGWAASSPPGQSVFVGRLAIRGPSRSAFWSAWGAGAGQKPGEFGESWVRWAPFTEQGLDAPRSGR